MKLKDKNITTIILFLLIIFFSCSRKVYEINNNQSSIKRLTKNGRFECKLTAYDLTEDVSQFSTKNDELMLFVYIDSMNNQYPKLIYQDYFVIDSLHKTKIFALNDSNMYGSMLTFVLIEIDSRKNLKQIEPVVRLNLVDLTDTTQNIDIKSINELFGDDDLLGIKRIPLSELSKKDFILDFKGIHLFDSYNYRIEIKSMPCNRR